MKKLIVNCKYNLKYNYYITSEGQVWSEKTKKFLSMQEDKDGYLKVRLISEENGETKRHRYSIHRLVMENFKPVENMDKLQVNHIDGNKKNNKLENLEWVTSKENIQHAINNNLRAKINGASKLSEEEVKQIIFLLLNSKSSYSEIAKQFNVYEEIIGRIKRKQLWKQLTKNINFN